MKNNTRVEEVIITNLGVRGLGKHYCDPIRKILQIYSKKGELLAENDTLTYDYRQLIDFTNWYIKAMQLDARYEIENLDIIESWHKGDDPSVWHK